MSLQLSAQEICDNAIDDDGDGMVDLNDEDCNCNTLLPSSLIPNPSFEEMTCCPLENEQLNCAVGWIQASPPTTDYVHTCGGYLGNTSIPAFAPLPFADGDGGVGFRDGQMNVGSNYKEYVGACLTSPMEVGATYRLDFFVGFQDNVQGSMDFNIALFASNACGNLPFGGNDFTIGCPLNAGGYVQLGETYVSGSNEWVNVVFEFEAAQAYELIVLGPSCAPNPNFILDPYFYVDRLTLAESSEFGEPFESISGSICENNLVLQVEDNIENSYQWYQDGIAMIGETDASLLLTSINDSAGTYMVVITSPNGCLFSQEYDLLIPPYYESASVEICEGENYMVGTEMFSEPGFYEILLSATDGCDSLLQLSLDVNMNSSAELQESFCEGDIYSFYDIETTEPGIFETILTNAIGCDSVVTLNLTSIGLGLGVELNDMLEIKLGETIDLIPNFIDPDYVKFAWSDETGQVLSDAGVLEGYQPVQTTTIYFSGFNDFGCGDLDSMEIKVISEYNMYVPNAFSPDRNGINDYFKFYAPLAVEKVNSFSIFDRWGGLVYESFDIADFDNFLGWDGTVKGEDANIGVYVYVIDALFIDGEEKIISGDVMLVR